MVVDERKHERVISDLSPEFSPFEVISLVESEQKRERQLELEGKKRTKKGGEEGGDESEGASAQQNQNKTTHLRPLHHHQATQLGTRLFPWVMLHNHRSIQQLVPRIPQHELDPSSHLDSSRVLTHLRCSSITTTSVQRERIQGGGRVVVFRCVEREVDGCRVGVATDEVEEDGEDDGGRLFGVASSEVGNLARLAVGGPLSLY